MAEGQTYIDTHVHFWDPEQLRYDWLTEVPPINRSFLPADIEDAAAGLALNLEQIVFVQADARPEQAIAEVEWVSELAEAEPRIGGIVADARLEEGDRVRPQLERLAAFPLVKGIRRLIQAEPPGFAVQPDFVRAVQLLPDYGFSFDICIYHPQMRDAIDMVAQCPDVQFVLDHVGKPGIRENLLEPWRGQLQELAAHGNVWCKLSGMVTEADHANWTMEDLRPYAEHVLAVFGPDRIMFGSDWPVVTLAASYRRWFTVANELLGQLSAHEQRQILYENAIRFYKLG